MTYWYIVFSYQTAFGGTAKSSRSVSITSEEFLIGDVRKSLAPTLENYQKDTLIIDYWQPLTQSQWKNFTETKEEP